MVLQTVTLASSHKMPLVGFGLWKVPADKAADIVYNVRFPLVLHHVILNCVRQDADEYRRP